MAICADLSFEPEARTFIQTGPCYGQTLVSEGLAVKNFCEKVANRYGLFPIVTPIVAIMGLPLTRC